MKIPATPQIRKLEVGDLEAADGLRALAGWNQTRADWERILGLEPEGCFAALVEGRIAGTVTATRFGDELAWIGMMLVHPDLRRRGIGRALLARCLERLRGRGIPCIGLDATPAGRPLYAEFGFREEWSLQRWEGELPRERLTAAEGRVRPLAPPDWPSIAALDRRAFGADRSRLLASLACNGRASLVFESQEGVTGFGMIRAGSRADYLGPLVAASAGAATALAQSLFADARAGVFWDIPDRNAAAVGLAERLGFRPQRPLYRMFLGDQRSAGDPLLVAAIADPATG